jgi:hypothetical protein
MTDCLNLINKFHERLEMRRDYLNKGNTLTTSEKLVWAEALEWCHGTLCALEQSAEAQELPEMPDDMGCSGCDD